MDEEYRLEDAEIINDVNNIVFSERVVYYVHNIHIDEDVDDPVKYREAFNIIRRASENDIINFHINSHGGVLVTFIQFFNLLLNCKAHTIAYVYNAHSVAGLLALSCKKIVVTEFSDMLFHNSSWAVEGTSTEMKDHSDFFFDWYKEILETVAKGFLTDKEIEKILDNKDLWLNSRDIKKRLDNRDKYLKGKK